MDQLKAEHTTALATLEAANTDKLDILRSSHDQAVAALSTELEGVKGQHASAQSLADDKGRQIETLESEVARLVALVETSKGGQDELQRIKSELDGVKDELVSTKEVSEG